MNSANNNQQDPSFKVSEINITTGKGLHSLLDSIKNDSEYLLCFSTNYHADGTYYNSVNVYSRSEYRKWKSRNHGR